MGPRICFPVCFWVRVDHGRNLCGIWKVKVKEEPFLWSDHWSRTGTALAHMDHPSALSLRWCGWQPGLQPLQCRWPSSLGFSERRGCRVCVLEGPPMSLSLEVVRDPRGSQFVFTDPVCPWPPPAPTFLTIFPSSSLAR